MDLKLKQINGEFKISFTNGDFTLTNGLDTAIAMSIFCEKRDNSIEDPLQRGGWWGNELQPVNGYEQGSLIWTQYQSRVNEQEASKARDSLLDGMNWFLQKNIASDVKVTCNVEGNSIKSNIDLYRNNNTQEAQSYDLWKNTGK